MIHLDTHVAMWLWVGELDRLPARLKSRLESDDLAVSPMVRLELAYLHEVGRSTHAAERVLDGLARLIGVVEDATPFSDVVAVAAQVGWTRDVFDRMIAAQALAAGAHLATRDRVIRAAIPEHTLWD
ncbi:PIN domain-containing protein [Nocardioides sambongensis]|uniref:PIN domain-containing protein n=1 Tax=Nocardioides sambongensis TaxID=2589074 RepID=UPI00112A49B2|nr:PIN domain-containing protein [Nocardioides sambongensis]